MKRSELAALARLFLKLGTTAFGGPAAHIAMMEEEVVVRRQWLSRDEFLDYLGATNLIPGPNSTELAIHVGQARAGWPGLLVAGACFILPAALIVGALGWGYVRYGSLPAVEGLLYGIKPVVIAIVLQALMRLARSAVKSWPLALLGVTAAVAVVLGVDELLVLGLAAGLASILLVPPRAGQGKVMALVPGLTALTAPAAFGLWPLFLVFLKIGSVLFGSGYVLLAFLRADLVERLGWLTERQLLDAIAVGQMTPGPVFTTATFVGYLLGGGSGAAVATIGIFLPAFFFVALSARVLPRLKASPVARAALDGINVASLALMAVVTWQLSLASLIDWPTGVLALISFAILLRYQLNSAWLVAAGGMIGLLVYHP
ncbi:MAG TPA: chromate efflux transporter [Gemmatimonadales bacterium]|nr:chromate efflux transporter [Gemmatimonadales bacterium]